MSLQSSGLRNGQRNEAIGRDVDHGFFALAVLLLQALDVEPAQISIAAAKLLLKSGDGLSAALGFRYLGPCLKLSRFLLGLGLQDTHLAGALSLHQSGATSEGPVVDTELRKPPKDERCSCSDAQSGDCDLSAIHDDLRLFIF